MKVEKVRSDLPVDPTTVAILRAVNDAASKEAAQVTLVGATARDIVLTHVHGIRVRRATADIDVALAIREWSLFEAVRKWLLKDVRFQRAEGSPNRFWFRGHPDRIGRPVDLVPFGHEPESSLFAWPEDKDIQMNVAGYADAAAAAMRIEIEPGFDFDVLSIPGLTLLKIFAWVDRHSFTQKDGDDLSFLLRNYLDVCGEERIYEEHLSTLESVDYDLARASHSILGADVADICSEQTRTAIRALLGDKKTVDGLAIDLARPNRLDPDALDSARRHLADFSNGFLKQPGNE